jgi:tetratricopeptide (TPR) repeat protein/NAD-dependent dihydropyrimidine dehydrogenase PreA subunit
MTSLPRSPSHSGDSPKRKSNGSIALPVLKAAGGGDANTGIRKSKSGPVRAAVLIGVHVIFLVHILLWLRFGRTVSPVEPSESMQTLNTGVINAGFIFFALAILSTIVFGRFFCGWGCHVVALQDLCSWMLKKVNIRPKPFRSRLLVFAPLVFALYMFVWPVVHRTIVFPLAQKHGSTQVQAFVGASPPFAWGTELIVEDFWATFPPLLVAIPFLFICGFAVVYFLGAKGFCTYGCPYGGFFAPMDKIAPGRIIVDHDKCEGCGHCTAVCTSNVRVHEEIRDFGMVVDQGCMKCMDCVSVCPNDALRFGFAKPSIIKGKPGARLRFFQKKGAKSRDPKGDQVGTSRHKPDFSMGYEVFLATVFLASFLAWRGAYGVIPLLMAAGVAACVTYIAHMLVQMALKKNLRLHNFQLRLKGAVKPAGVVFGALALLTIATTAQAGFTRVQAFRANLLDNQVGVPASAVFVQNRPEIPAEQLALAERALALYTSASSFEEGGAGLANTPLIEVRRAWLHSVLGDYDKSIEIIRGLLDRREITPDLAISLTTLHDLRGDRQAAIIDLQRALALKPSMTRVRVELARRLASSGQMEEARSLMAQGVEERPWDAQQRIEYANLLMAMGKHADAESQARAALDEIEKTKEEHRSLDPAFALRILAETQIAQGKVDDALATLDRVIELQPDNPEPPTTAAQLLVRNRRIGDAAKYLDLAEAAQQRLINQQQQR